jgi:hypothetical protein
VPPRALPRTQAGQGVTAALGIGHDNGGGDALPQYGLNLDAAQFSYSVRSVARLDRAWSVRGVRVRRCG